MPHRMSLMSAPAEPELLRRHVGYWMDSVAKVESCRATNFHEKSETGSDRRFV